MATIGVVTDSATDLDPSVAESHGIKIVDLDVRLGDIGPDVTGTWSPEQFWQQCARSSSLAGDVGTVARSLRRGVSRRRRRRLRRRRVRNDLVQAVGDVSSRRGRRLGGSGSDRSARRRLAVGDDGRRAAGHRRRQVRPGGCNARRHCHQGYDRPGTHPRLRSARHPRQSPQGRSHRHRAGHSSDRCSRSSR